MTFIKDFINVLSAASISFLLLTSIFSFVVFFNLMDGKLRSKGGSIFIAFGALFVVAGFLIKPLLYRGIAYFVILFFLSNLGGRLWDKGVGLRLLVGIAAAFALSMLDPN